MEEEVDKDMEMVVRPRDVVWNKTKMPFMFLPYRIFVEWTNIAELIEKHKENEQKNSPTDIELEDRIREVHRDLYKVSWTQLGLYDLKFTYNPEQRLTEASIFRLHEIKSIRIYKNATDFQRQFLFAPLPLLVQATNVREVATLLHTTKFPEELVTDENLVAIIDQMHSQMHKLNRWTLGRINDLRFLTPKKKNDYNVPVPIKRRKGRPRKCLTEKVLLPAIKMVPVKQRQKPSRAPKQSRIHEIAKRTRKRLHEEESNRAQSSDEVAISPNKSKTTELNSSDSSVASNNSSKNQRLNTEKITSISNASGSKLNRCAKRSQQRSERSNRTVQDFMNLVSSEDDVYEAVAKKPKSSSANKAGTSSELPGSSGKANTALPSSKIMKNLIHKPAEVEKCAPTQWQIELHQKLKSLSIEEFIVKTNIKHLIEEEIGKKNGSPVLFEHNLKKGIEKIFKVIQKPDKWNKFELMQNLEFLNVESDPSGNTQMNMNNDEPAHSSCQEKNDMCIQVEMPAITDDILSEISVNRLQSLSINNSDQNDTAAVDEIDVNIMNFTQIVTSSQTCEETQFGGSVNSSLDHLNQTAICVTPNCLCPPSTSSPKSQVDNPDVPAKIKIEPGLNSPKSQAKDSEVICEGTLIDSPIIIQDSDEEMREIFELMDGTAIKNYDSDSFGFTNRSMNQENQEAEVNEATAVHESTTSETSETILTEVVGNSTIITTGTIMLVNSGSTMRSSALQSIENTMSAEPTILNQSSASKRPIDEISDEQITTKRPKKRMNDDTLSNIKPPKYDYPPLQLINKQSNGTVQCTVGQKLTNVNNNKISIHIDDDIHLSSSPQIDSYQTTQATQATQSNVIEEFDTSNEMEESNTRSQKRSQIQSTTMKLLTQDNTWFLDVNTQLVTGSDTCAKIAQPSTSNQQIAPLPTLNIQTPQPVTVNSNEKSIAKIVPLSTVPSNFRQDFTFQYLHYVNMEHFESKLVKKAGEQNLNFNLLLKYQCNGFSKVIVNGDSLKLMLNVTENEWKALNQVLYTIDDIAYNLNYPSNHKSLLHEIIFYVFKTTSTFSKVQIQYSETDFDTARACYKPYVIDDVDVTPAFDSKFLKSLKDFRNNLV